MSLRDRPGPGVQGFPILFIATAESIYVQRTLPRTWTGTTVGALVPLDDILEGLGKRSLGAGLVGRGPAPPAPTPGVGQGTSCPFGESGLLFSGCGVQTLLMLMLWTGWVVPMGIEKYIF